MENNYHGCKYAFLKILFKIILFCSSTPTQFILFPGWATGGNGVVILCPRILHIENFRQVDKWSLKGLSDYSREIDMNSQNLLK